MEIDLVSALVLFGALAVSYVLAEIIVRKAREATKDYVINYLMEHPEMHEEVKKLFGWK